MGITSLIITNYKQDMAYFIGRNLWKYNMINFTNTYYTLYYGIKYFWKYRDKIKKKIMKKWENNNITWKIKNTFYNNIPKITYNT